MKQLLVALNFSEQSLVIFKYAMKLAQHFGANVDFAYILPETQIGEEQGKYYNKVKDQHVEKAESRLHEYIQSHYGKQYHEILINTHVRVGGVSEELTELAMVLGSELLLVGKHYQTRFSFFDDTANSLISTCPCPVMTIPENSQYCSIKRIIYASTFLLEDCNAIFQLQQWLETFKGELICINVSKDKSQLVLAKRKMAILERLFPQEDITFRCFMSEKALSIERYTSLNEGDILCSMHKDRNMFQLLFQPSTSKALANKSPRPMIIFHQHMMSSKF